MRLINTMNKINIYIDFGEWHHDDSHTDKFIFWPYFDLSSAHLDTSYVRWNIYYVVKIVRHQERNKKLERLMK